MFITLIRTRKEIYFYTFISYYTDGIMLIADSERKPKEFLDEVVKGSKNKRLIINFKKTE